MSRYKGYTKKGKEISLQYRKKSQHTVSLAYKKAEWENEILPAIKKSELPVATFIKEAVREKIVRESLGEK